MCLQKLCRGLCTFLSINPPPSPPHHHPPGHLCWLHQIRANWHHVLSVQFIIHSHPFIRSNVRDHWVKVGCTRSTEAEKHLHPLMCGLFVVWDLKRTQWLCSDQFTATVPLQASFSRWRISVSYHEETKWVSWTWEFRIQSWGWCHIWLIGVTIYNTLENHDGCTDENPCFAIVVCVVKLLLADLPLTVVCPIEK